MVKVSEVKLETKRLSLRAWQMDDVLDFFEYASVAGVGEMAGWRAHESLNTSKMILTQFIEQDNVFAIVDKSNQKVIGSLGFHDTDRETVKEMGYVLSKSYWGQGLMHEAMMSAIAYCFTQTTLTSLKCGHFTQNHQSKRVIEKCGFSYTCDGTYVAKQLNEVFESRHYELNKADWFNQNTTF